MNCFVPMPIELGSLRRRNKHAMYERVFAADVQEHAVQTVKVSKIRHNNFGAQWSVAENKSVD